MQPIQVAQQSQASRVKSSKGKRSKGKSRRQDNQPGIKINVLISGTDKIIPIPAGNGNQTVKWLALAVAQRLVALPRGSLRARENRLQGVGFAVPGEVGAFYVVQVS